MPLTASAISAGLQTVGGLVQTFTSGVKKKERALENFSQNSPQYNPNKGILDFYAEAKNKYGLNQYDSAIYKKAVQDTQRSTAQGLDSLKGRGGSIAGVSNLIAGQNDKLLNASVAAENAKRNDFSILGNAANMKAREDSRAFQINQQDPFERKYNLLAQKASAAAKQKQDGLANIFGGLSNASTLVGDDTFSGKKKTPKIDFSTNFLQGD